MTSSHNANETIKINYLFSESLNLKNKLLTDLLIFHSILFYNSHTLSIILSSLIETLFFIFKDILPYLKLHTIFYLLNTVGKLIL